MKKCKTQFILGIILMIGVLVPRLGESHAQEMVPNWVSKFVLSGDGDAVAIVDRYGVGVYWLDAVDAEPIHFAQDLSISITQIVLSPDGALVATLHDSASLQILEIDEELASGLGWVWDAATGERLYELDGHEELTSLRGLAFSRDGQFVAYGGVSNGTVYIKDTATGETVASLNPRENDPDWEEGLVIPSLDGLQFDPSGLFLLTHHRAQLTMWDMETWDEIGELTGTPNIFVDFVIAEGGYVIAALDSFGNPFAWLARDTSPLFETEIGQYEVDAVGFNGNSSTVGVTVNPELGIDQLELIELETGTTRVLTIEELDLSAGRLTLQFVGNGKLLILMQNDGLVRYAVVDIDEEQLVLTYETTDSEPPFSVDTHRTRLAIRDGSTVVIFSLETGDMMTTINLPTEGPMPPLK